MKGEKTEKAEKPSRPEQKKNELCKCSSLAARMHCRGFRWYYLFHMHEYQYDYKCVYVYMSVYGINVFTNVSFCCVYCYSSACWFLSVCFRLFFLRFRHNDLSYLCR